MKTKETINVILRNILNCTDRQKEAVRKIRNQETVRRSMYTEHKIPPKEHLIWIDNLSRDNKQAVFVILIEDKAFGIVSLNAIDKLHSKTDWAFYIDQNMRGGLGSALEFNFLNFIFDDLHFDKLNCEVIETNSAVVALHKNFGFTEEGLRRENIIKNHQRIGVFFLGLTKSEWIDNREKVFDKFKEKIQKFDINIENQLKF